MDQQVESLIEDAALSAHLATTVENRPHVAPVWYDYHDGHLRVLTGWAIHDVVLLCHGEYRRKSVDCNAAASVTGKSGD